MLDKTDLLESISRRINSALRIALASDPANKTFLAKLDGALIRVNAQSPTVSLLITINTDEIEITHISLPNQTDEAEPAEEENPVDLSISGSTIDLTKLLTSPMDNAASLSDTNVSITGDVGLLLKLSQVAKMIEIDWELLLAERIGETPAVLLSQVLRAGFKEVKKIQQDLNSKLKAKLESESSPIANKEDWQKAKDELRELNYRLDRLEAKIALRKQNI